MPDVSSAQVLLQAAFLAGNVQWAETREARRVLLLLGFPKAQSPLELIVVRPQMPSHLDC